MYMTKEPFKKVQMKMWVRECCNMLLTRRSPWCTVISLFKAFFNIAHGDFKKPFKTEKSNELATTQKVRWMYDICFAVDPPQKNLKTDII